MDNYNDVLEVQREQRDDQALRPVSVKPYLKRIDTPRWPPERLQWLWEQTMKEDYASDDIGAATPEFFISNLFLGNSRHYEFGDDAYIAILNIIARVNADMHFAVWGNVSIPTIVDCHTQLAREMFDHEGLNVNRLTAYIPAFNKKMIRFATVLGYKYEGEIRKIFLKNGQYHNLFIYGLLQEEWIRRKV